MKISSVDLDVVAIRRSQYPEVGLPEFLLIGRSNVGKSSFINKLLNRKSLARTSSKPGKTATINFYNIDNAINFVDLPGYGFAQVSKEEKAKWGKMIETYLNSREQLKITALLVDARHKPTKEDAQMADWIRERHGYLLIFVTKCDKIAKTKLNDHLDDIYYTLNLTDDDIMIPFSAQTGLGVDDAWEAICEICEVEK